ncbi:MAG: transposase [Candidatus Desulfatibia sp.]|uniref:transposase n=1 Tax=Candidatus Desulfatibia sp. TaxID=3101189 RepID=UPI002F34E116
MKKYRHFDEDFKREVVFRIDSGVMTKAQASREYNLSSSLIDRWQKQIHDGSMRSSPSAREKQLERELEMYKKKVGELSMQVDLLKKLKEFSASMRRLNGYVVTGKLAGQSGKDAK